MIVFLSTALHIAFLAKKFGSLIVSILWHSVSKLIMS